MKKHKKIKIIFLGTNGWYDTNTGNTLSILIETDEFNLILDAGGGLSKLDKWCDQSKPTYLFISHYHLDHIWGLHTLTKFNFKNGLTIFGQPGISNFMTEFVNQPLTKPFDQLTFKTNILEVPYGIEQLPFKCEVAELLHASYTQGLRFEYKNRIISFCPDTGYCDNAVKLAKNADLLIAECAHLPGESNPLWPHLNPEIAAQLAQEAKAKKLVLTHFDAKNYPTIKSRKKALPFAKKIFKESYISKDDLILKI